jgi:ABC-2 type transport system ATP-binding protein
MMPELCISNIHKTYNPGLFKKKVKAVSDLSFDVNQGEVFGLIGPNGAGKSTTIRMLLGLIRPDSGTILFRGQPLADAAIQRVTGYLPENPYLYDHLSLLELLTFCGQASGLNAVTIAERGQLLMGKLNLLEAQKRPLRTFSKGMLQRAGICFALLHDPAIVILDEPMSGLDPIGRKMVFDLVMELKNAGKTIFFCSHILNDVERLCDRIGLINRGRLMHLFERDEFQQHYGKTVFLQLTGLERLQQQRLIELGGRLRVDGTTQLLAIPDDSYFSVNSYLEKIGAEILGCRSEWETLEELFMRIIKEQEA